MIPVSQVDAFGSTALDTSRDSSKRRPVSPNSTVRVGLLGAGYIADWHAKALGAIKHVEVAAVCDRDASRAQALARRLGSVEATTSLDAMLRLPELDCVHVLLPPEHHAAAARAILESGKHVFLEKPMAIEESECESLIEIAKDRDLKIGVGHNFLFARPYEALKADIDAGRLGPIDHVTITWNKPLGQITAGPFGSWLFREPWHVMLEIGPHSFAHMIDLLGDVEIVASRASHPVDLPLGRRFFCRWKVDGESQRAGVSLLFSFAPGFSEHTIHVRGRIASATADFERGTYTLHRHTKYGTDFDRYVMSAKQGSSLRAQGRSNFVHYALSKFKLSRRGNIYGESINLAVETFYKSLRQGEDDRRISPRLGRDVVAQCVRAGRMACPVSTTSPAIAPTAAVEAVPRDRTDILVLGATGFIGKELTRQLQAQGRSMRLLVRDPSRTIEGLDPQTTEIVIGDASRPEDLKKALDGVDHVVHLARSQSKTWDEYYQRDVLVTKNIAEACLAAGVRRLIYSGTIDSFYAGGRAGTINDDTPLDPKIAGRNNYARAKAASEQVLLDLHRTHGLPVVIVRPGIVIGRGGHPHHWGVGMWPWDSVCQVWGNGSKGLPLVLVEDVASAIIKAVDVPGIEGESFNLVGPTCVSTSEYLEELEKHAGAAIDKYFTAPWKFFLADLGKFAVKVLVRHPGRRLTSYRDWETRTQRAAWDCSKTRERLGWSPVEDREEIIRRGIHVPVEEFLL